MLGKQPGLLAGCACIAPKRKRQYASFAAMEDPKTKKSDAFEGGEERVGYEPVSYHRDEKEGLRGNTSDVRGASALGSLIASGGVIWGVYLATQRFTSVQNISPRGPIELAGVGILIWLHAKWRSR